MLKEIIIAIHSYFTAHPFVWRKQPKWLWLIGMVNGCLWISGLYFFYHSSTRFSEYLIIQTNIKAWLQSENTLLQFFFVTALLMANLVLLIYCMSVIKYLYLLLFAPVLAQFSLYIHATISGRPYKSGTKAVWQNSRHAMRTAIQNFCWQSLYFIFFLLLSLLPVIGWVTPLIALLAECYFSGYAYLDHQLLQRNYPGIQIRNYIQKHKGLAIGNGLLFYGLHIIPLLGWMLAPLYAIIAASYTIDEFEQS